MSEIEITEALQRELGRLFMRGLRINDPLQGLQEVREKLSERGYEESQDKSDILEELTRIEQLATGLGREAGRIRALLNLEAA
jgi:hypothetical protein